MQKGKGEIKGEKKKKWHRNRLTSQNIWPHLKDAREEFMGEVPLGKRNCSWKGCVWVAETIEPQSTECSDVITEVTEFCCGPGNLCTLTALHCGELWAVLQVLCGVWVLQPCRRLNYFYSYWIISMDILRAKKGRPVGRRRSWVLGIF